MVRRGRSLRTVASVALATALVAGLTACDPPPPRPHLTVTTQADGGDTAPGDGTCSSAAAGGECTLRAAFDEANALGVADITVPGGDYLGTDSGGSSTSLLLTATGDIRVNWGNPQAVGTLGHFDVRPGAVLALDGVRRMPSANLLSGLLTINVGGVLVLRGGVFNSTPRATTPGGTYTPLVVQPGGLALVMQSVLAGWTSGIRTSGVALVSDSTLMSSATSTLDVQGDGQAHLRATSISGASSTATGGCAGTPPTSLGYVQSDTPCAAVPGTGDVVGAGQVSFAALGRFSLAPTSAVIDQIPVGAAGCPVGAVDINGDPRAVDGDGDGVVACDIGAIEHQPPPVG